MDALSHELLTCATLRLDKYGRVRISKALGNVNCRLQRRRVPQDIIKVVDCL